MPADTNPAGDILGGWPVSQRDLAAVTARRPSRSTECGFIAR
jgi:acyl-CoA hydrolase